MSSRKQSGQAMPEVNPAVFYSADTNDDLLMPDAQVEYYPSLYDSQHGGSCLTDDMSYVNIPTPSGATDNSSFVNMSRSSSNNSNKVSEDSGGQAYSTPSQGSEEIVEHPWIHGGDLLVDENSFIPQDNNSLLLGMHLESGSSGPPYQASYMVNCMYPDAFLNYNAEPSSQTSDLLSPFQQSQFDTRSEGPWNHIPPYNVRHYGPGDVAFAPSPEFTGDQNSESQYSITTNISRRTHSNKSKARAKSPKAKQIQNSNETQYTFVAHSMEKDTSVRRTGVRKGHLDPETAAKARRLRKVKACWKCRIQKVPCSEGEVCKTCIKQYPGLAREVCCRSSFIDHNATFFPDWLHCHFDKEEIESFINANTVRFYDTTLDIELSPGGVFKPFKVQANSFEPKTWELLEQYQLVAQGDQQSQQLAHRYSAPIGIMNLMKSDMKNQCKKYIEAMIKNPLYAKQTTFGYTTDVPCIILEATRKYSIDLEKSGQKSSLIHDVLMLHAIHYFMAVFLSMTEDSKMKVQEEVMRDCRAPPGEYMSSRLLNRQIKYAMHLAQREVLDAVLVGLEKALKLHAKEEWGAIFCTLLVMCLCIEELQAAADTFIVSDMLTKGTSSEHTRFSSEIACLALEELPYRQFTELFHAFYRSRRESKGREGGLNPFRDNGTKWDGPTKMLVETISSRILDQNRLLELSAKPFLVDHAYDVNEETPGKIRPNHTGRIAARFLLSFIRDSE